MATEQAPWTDTTDLKRVHTYLTLGLLARLDTYRRRAKVSRSHAIREAVRRYLEEHGQ